MTKPSNPDSNTHSSLSVNDEDSDSPCIGICSTLFDDVCQGCGRTALEVCNWVFMSSEEKQAVWARITSEATAMRFTRKD
ncbi:MAG: DUF1289 domain-containing protein [Polynucleobacter sp.]|jgi:uncharacterized protein|nr:MAG: DUF1289 domain-containing protein [Polynucleobacter sp.]